MPGQAVPDPVPRQGDITTLFLWFFSQEVAPNLLSWALSRQGLPGKAVPLCSFHTAGPMQLWAGDKVCL